MSDIIDYISEDERKRIATEAFRDVCLDKFQDDAERIFSNAAYSVVWKIVDDTFDGNAGQMIADKIPDLIKNLSGHSVFRQSEYGRPKSEGQMALDRAVRENAPAIDAAVKAAAATITKDDIMDAILEGGFTVSVGRES